VKSTVQPDLQSLRIDYAKGELLEADVSADAMEQFARWFTDARQNRPGEPNAMTLATADALGRPSARVVLLKDFGPRGFTFFGNYDSRKGHELSTNPQAALVFHWAVLERQVRIEGRIEKVTRAESKAYYDIRPRNARVGAHASEQSRVVESREALDKRFAELDATLPQDVPLPEQWGGWRLVPTSIEFWQGRPSRLHDRLLYTRVENNWKIERLCP